MLRPTIVSLFLFFSIFHLLSPCHATASSHLGFSMIQTVGNQTADEFIEIYNPLDTPVNLSSWSIRKKTKSDITAKGTSLKTFSASDIIPAKGYFLWTNSGSIFKDFADTTTTGSLTDDNSLGLFDSTGILVDAVTWGEGHLSPFFPSQITNPKKNERVVKNFGSGLWTLSLSDQPRNSRGEIFHAPETSPPVTLPASLPEPSTIRINEFLPNPSEKDDAGEFIELYNFGDKSIDLSGWAIRDASKTGKYIFPSGVSLDPSQYLVLWDTDFTFALNNTNETVSLFDTLGSLVHRVAYEKTREGVSLNWTPEKMRAGKQPTPGQPNELNQEPAVKERVPKKGYQNFPIEFKARGTDADGDALEFTWNFGDGKKSYKEKTTHTYKETGRYTVTLTTDDGSETTSEQFEIEIEKYRPPKLRIVAWLPNPPGTDTDNEWIEIENLEKKTVNLKNFSIATGNASKKVTNHPIREDFRIGGKERKRITRASSLFTLGNTKGYIELRAPDGSVIHKTKYAFEKSIADGVILRKEKGSALTLSKSSDEKSDTASESSEIPNPDNSVLQSEEDNEPKNNPAVLGVLTTVPTPESCLSAVAQSSEGMPKDFLPLLGLLFESLNAKINALWLFGFDS